MLDRYIVENHGGIDSALKILFENQISRGLYSRGDKKLSRRVMEYNILPSKTRANSEKIGRIRFSKLFEFFVDIIRNTESGDKSDIEIR